MPGDGSRPPRLALRATAPTLCVSPTSVRDLLRAAAVAAVVPGGDRGPRRFDKPRESLASGGNHHPVQIAEVLKEGQEILVQIAKEPLGTKGARITSHVALPGRYLVYMPTIDHIGVSRKIASEEERLRLRNIILENKGSLTGGFIVRTAGQGRSEEEFKADLKFLSTLWAEIRAKSRPPEGAGADPSRSRPRPAPAARPADARFQVRARGQRNRLRARAGFCEPLPARAGGQGEAL